MRLAVARRATITAALGPEEFEIPDPESCVHTVQREACPTGSPVHHPSLFSSQAQHLVQFRILRNGITPAHGIGGRRTRE